MIKTCCPLKPLACSLQADVTPVILWWIKSQNKITAVFHCNWMKDSYYSLGYAVMCRFNFRSLTPLWGAGKFTIVVLYIYCKTYGYLINVPL